MRKERGLIGGLLSFCKGERIADSLLFLEELQFTYLL